MPKLNETLTAEQLADHLNGMTATQIAMAISEIINACESASAETDALRELPILAPGSRSRTREALCNWEWPKNFAAQLSRQRTA